jgi:hypothetical protein
VLGLREAGFGRINLKIVGRSSSIWQNYSSGSFMR